MLNDSNAPKTKNQKPETRNQKQKKLNNVTA